MALSKEDKEMVMSKLMPVVIGKARGDLLAERVAAEKVVAEAKAAVDVADPDPSKSMPERIAYRNACEELQMIEHRNQALEQPEGLFNLLLDNIDLVMDKVACEAYCKAREIEMYELAKSQAEATIAEVDARMAELKG